MTVNYDRVCRLCLSSRGELLPIFPTTSSDDLEPPILASKIKDCVSVQINENDDLPTNVCRKCVDNVNNWHLFKTVCTKTQNKLLSLIRKDGSLLEEVQIKSEPFFDEAYDDGVVIDGSYPEAENASFSSKLQPEGPPILASLGLTPRSDKRCVDPRMDWHRVHAILDLVQENNIIDSLQSVEESDVIHHSDHESDTEAELQPDLDDTFIDCKKGYACRNKNILHKKPQRVISGTKDAIKLRKRKVNVHCGKPKNAWQLLFTDDLLDLIVSSTNENILTQHKGHEGCTNVGEIKTLIGIFYLNGIMRPTHHKCSDLWDKDCGVPSVINAMTNKRFNFLLQNICFYNQVDDDSIMQFDTMKRIRKLFEIFAMNCRTTFDVDSTAVVDEIIVPVYGPCPFRYDIDKKPLKRGIKMVLLVDPNNFYVSNLDVITDPYFGAEELVKKLTQHIYGTGKTIIMDSWYFSSQLMKTLKNEQLYTIAALHPKSDGIPPLFMSQYRKSCTYISGFVDCEVSLTSHVNSQLKATNVVTNVPQFYRKGHTNRTTSVSAYKKNQSAVEVLDVLMHYYTTLQHTNDWTLSLFFTLLNIASVNAQVIWSSQKTPVTPRRLFIRDLGLGLLEDEVSVSLTFISEPGGKKLAATPLLAQTYFKNRRRCRICATSIPKRDRRTKQYCLKCGQFICREHSVSVCTTCAHN